MFLLRTIGSLALGALSCFLLIMLGICASRLVYRPKNAGIELLFRERQERDDEEFYNRFYLNSGVPAEIPTRIRRVFQAVFGESMLRLEPADNLFIVFDGLDPLDVLAAIQREFQLTCFRPEASPSGWSFDSIVQYVCQNVGQSPTSMMQ